MKALKQTKPGKFPGFFFPLLLALLCPDVFAQNDAARLIIIIDDIGNNRKLGQRTVDLPGPLNLAFLPHTPFARTLATDAFEQGHSIMLHSPMANTNGADLGPGGLTETMSTEELQNTLKDNIAAIPHVEGVNNHMGSLLTQNPDAMDQIMKVIQQHGLFFVDSLTTPASVALQRAHQHGLPALERDVFLDHEATPEAIHRQFERAVSLAQRRGMAVLIGHPYPETLDYLEANLNTLGQRNIRLHKVSQYLYDRLWNPRQLPASRYQLRPYQHGFHPHPISANP